MPEETAGIPEDGVIRLRQLLDELRDRQAPLLAAVGRISARVREGALAAADDVAELTAWQVALDEVARLLAADASALRLAGLAGEIARAEARLTAARQEAELAALLGRIAALAADGERHPLLQVVIEMAGAVEPAALPEERKEAFRALYRLMMTAALTDVDPADAETVHGAFGMMAAMAAVGALLPPGGGAAEAAPAGAALAAGPAPAEDAPAPVAVIEPEPVAVTEPEPVAVTEPEPVAEPESVEPEPVAEPESVEPEPVAEAELVVEAGCVAEPGLAAVAGSVAEPGLAAVADPVTGPWAVAEAAAPAAAEPEAATELVAVPEPKPAFTAKPEAETALNPETVADPKLIVEPVPTPTAPVVPVPGLAAGPALAAPAAAEAAPAVPEPVLAVAEPVLAVAEPASPEQRLAAALAAGRTGLAYWYSVAFGLPAPVRAAFEVLALSEAVTVDGDDASVRIRELLKDFDVTSVWESGPDNLKVLAAGTARALLLMPFSPCGSVLSDALLLLGDDDGCDFLKAVKQAGDFRVELGKLNELRARSEADLDRQRDAALARLRSVLGTVRAASTKFPRATMVLKKIVGDAGALGGPVTAVLAAPDDVSPAERVLELLRDAKAVERLIDETDQRMKPVAARRAKIESVARDQIRSNLADLLAALRGYVEIARALAARSRPVNSDERTAAVEALAKSVAGPEDSVPSRPTAGYYAEAMVRDWMRGVLAGRGDAPGSRQSPVERDLVRGFEVTRLPDGTVDPATVAPRLLDAIAGRSAQDAYDGFVAMDDHLGAERLIEVLRADGAADLAAQLAARQPDDQRSSRERLRRLVDQADQKLAQAQFAEVLRLSESVSLRGELERYRSLDVEEFPVARRRLDEIIRRVEEARGDAISSAGRRLDSLECSDADRRRIRGQLESGDVATAREFLNLLELHKELPVETATDNLFGEFWPGFVRGVEEADGQPGDSILSWLEQKVRNPGEISGVWLRPREYGPVIERGLQGWLALVREKRGGNWEEALRAVLTLLGLEVKGRFPGNPHRAGRWSTEVRARMIGNALVPSYGSGSDGHYQLLLCWEKYSTDRLLEEVRALPRKSPAIVLYFNTLPRQDRKFLAERSRPQHKDVSAVVIDNAVIAFLTSRTEPRLQATMGLTLPFTAVNPYTPHVQGNVPREVFYGRQHELAAVTDANGPLYVYGGRQLGKSALLKTAMREFAESSAQWRSVYLDLKGEGVGGRREPDDLWAVLVPELKRAGVIDEKVSAKAPAEAVARAIRQWLEDDIDRRLLLLLDEADDFLETDARARGEGKGTDSRFANVYLLKNLMDASGRRFKPVFAGLHKVQRFHSVSNGPMAHVGAEILIGPLPPGDAYKLVAEPLAAIGYRFERPEVWRLLAYTNYQANLIQSFCDALVRRMHRRALAHDAPPTLIRDRDVEETYSDRDVRKWIVERFELTLDLDKRYRVIAYTTAWLTNNTEQQVFALITLYDECKTFWPTGFAGLSLDDFGAYLDEMVGLGVLVRTQDDEYGIRSPNVVRLLGAPEEIERKLAESEDVLEVDPLFDAAVFRRAFGGDPDRRSPLTEQQVQQILEGRETPDGREQLHVVLGSKALGLDRVAEALRAAKPEGFEVTLVTGETINAEITGLARIRGGWQHVVLDLAGCPEDEQRAAVRRLHQFVVAGGRRSGSCLVWPETDWLWDASLRDVPVRRVRIRPWTQDTLRAWAPECAAYPLSNADQRRLLLEDTGGWPELVETAVRAARHAAVDQARRQAVMRVTGSQAAQEFLESVGMSKDPVTTKVVQAAAILAAEVPFDELAFWVEEDLPGAEREAVLMAASRLVDLGVLSHGSNGDSYLINSLIGRLLSQP